MMAGLLVSGGITGLLLSTREKKAYLTCFLKHSIFCAAVGKINTEQ